MTTYNIFSSPIMDRDVGQVEDNSQKTIKSEITFNLKRVAFLSTHSPRMLTKSIDHVTFSACYRRLVKVVYIIGLCSDVNLLTYL